MEQEQAYLDEDISVRQLSKELDIPHHHPSMTINIEFDQIFFNYVNGRRIRHAGKLLAAPGGIKESILNIAYRSGFQSKTSFNKVFKAHYHTTPTEYRKLNASEVTSATK